MPTRPPVHVPSHGDRAASVRAYNRDRGAPSARGYDYLWTRFRLAYLADHPLCADCAEQGRTTAANELHHIIKLRDQPDLRLDPENIRGLCKPCHSLRTSRGE